MYDYKLERPIYMKMTVTDITQMRDGYGVTASCAVSGSSIWWMEDEKPEYEVGQEFSISFKWDGVNEEQSVQKLYYICTNNDDVE